MNSQRNSRKTPQEIPEGIPKKKQEESYEIPLADEF